jgi:zinc/manganese transport system ATP-binding protein
MLMTVAPDIKPSDARPPAPAAANHVVLDIAGMTCAPCASRVEAALGKVPGVTGATVNLALERADVAVRTRQATPEALVAAVEGIGFGAQARSASAAERRREEEEREAARTAAERRSFALLVIAAALTAPLVLPMIVAPFGARLHVKPWIELLLATPVQFVVGARFYKAATGRPGLDNPVCNTITSRHDPPSPPSGPRPSLACHSAVAAAPLGAAAAGGGHGGRGGAVGGGILGDDMTAQMIFRDLTLGYDRHPAVHHLDGSVKRGALMAVVGPNGAGKSTLFKGIVGAIAPLAGAIDLGGLRARDIAYLPQAADIDRSFPIDVYDLVSTGLWRRTGAFGGIGGKARQEVHRAIAAVGLTGFEERPIGTLSGGQMQRVLFARVLLQNADLIVLDEPFNAIDAKTAADLFDLVRRWHAEERTVVAALHDLDLVRANFPEVLLLAREPVAWGPAHDVLTPENLLKARRMCEAFDDEANECRVDAA